MLVVGLTTCASAAGPQARARTRLRSLARSRTVPPKRNPAPPWPVGCMRGLAGIGARPTAMGQQPVAPRVAGHLHREARTVRRGARW
jgi:hypothetical protein